MKAIFKHRYNVFDLAVFGLAMLAPEIWQTILIIVAGAIVSAFFECIYGTN